MLGVVGFGVCAQYGCCCISPLLHSSVSIMYVEILIHWVGRMLGVGFVVHCVEVDHGNLVEREVGEDGCLCGWWPLRC